MKWQHGILVVVGVACTVVVMAMSHNDAIREQSTYCANVADSTWPDYRGIYREECGGKEPPPFRQKGPKLDKNNSAIVLTASPK